MDKNDTRLLLESLSMIMEAMRDMNETLRLIALHLEDINRNTS